MNFSVIIPLYNKAPYIEKAVRSVLAQTYKEFELIVIDDGSIDNSYEIVQNLFSSLTPPSGGWGATSQQNQGVSTTRNNGVKLAKYDYISFLDADDWWAPTYLEEMKNLMEDYPEAGIYGSSYFKVKNGRYIPAGIGVEPGFEKGYVNYFEIYAKTMWMPLTSISVVIRKEVFMAENGFKPQLKLGEDFDLWVRIALKYPVALLNKPLAYYNQDVDVKNRAVGVALYKPEEHMLFSNYGVLMENPDFKWLYEKLAVYGLLPYYLSGINKMEVSRILSGIRWRLHPFKYVLYYRVIPRVSMMWWFKIRSLLYILKQKIIHGIKE